jgi:hypothetical protein
MEKSKKQKTTQEDLQKGTQSRPSGLIYWDDYNFKQNNTQELEEIEYTPS